MMSSVASARGGGGGGGVWGHPSIDDLKKLKPFFLKRSAFFHKEFAEIAVLFFCAIQQAY